MPDRATAGCLAHQSEAPARWPKRRDLLLQCPLHESEGRRERGPIRRRRSNPPAPSSETVENTSTRRKSPALRGAVSEASLGRFACGEWESPAPSSHQLRRPGCSRATRRRGARIRASPSLPALSPCATTTSVEEAQLVTAARDSLREPRAVARCGDGDLDLCSGRGSSARSSVLVRRKRCRNRLAVSGSEKRGVDPFLTEHRFPSTGSSAWVRAEGIQKISAASACARRNAECRFVMAKS